MVVVVGGTDGGLFMLGLDLPALYEGNVTAQTATTVTVDEGNGLTAHFTREGMAYNALGQLVGGRITGISEDYLGVTKFSLTGINVSSDDFQGWVVNHQSKTAMMTIMAGNDTVTGTSFDDYLMGFGGHDVLIGGAGADILDGGDGNDHLYGQSSAGGPDGNDALSGGNGSDYLQGNAGDDFLEGGAGSDRMYGGSGNDRLWGDDGNDTINGNLGNDNIQGDAGNDSLRGGQGDDFVGGGDGNDVLYGDLGDDGINGADGDDTMTGGAGSDVFSFHEGYPRADNPTQTDLITDYQSGLDHLSIPELYQNLANYFPIKDLGETRDSVAEMRTHASSAVPDGAMAVYHEDGDTYLFWQSRGSAIFNHALILRGEHTITAADFV